jgi:hypothetical protein
MWAAGPGTQTSHRGRGVLQGEPLPTGAAGATQGGAWQLKG